MSFSNTVRVGVELEFMTPQHLSTGGSSSSSDTRWAADPPPEDTVVDMQRANPSPWADAQCVLRVCQVMAAGGVPVACYHPMTPHPQNPITHNVPPGHVLQTDGMKRMRVWNQNAVGPASCSSRPSRFGYWFVVRESQLWGEHGRQIMKAAPKGYKWFTTEINSPIMTGPRELDNHLPTLHRILTSLQANIKIWLNSGCGLHIHISHLQYGMDLGIAKRLVSLVYVLEGALLLQLCHPVRRKSPHTNMISVESRIAEGAWPGLLELTDEAQMQLERLESTMKRLKVNSKSTAGILQAFKAIWTQSDIDTLRKGLWRVEENHQSEGLVRCGLAISPHGSFEFRYPEATFDIGFINLWVDLVRRIMAIAARPPEEVSFLVCKVYETTVTRGAKAWITLLELLGLESQVGTWGERRGRYKGDLRNWDKQSILIP